MSKQKIEKIVRQEIETLNEKIDRKIILGLSYGAEARRHRFLQSRLHTLRKASPYAQGFLGRVFSFGR